MLYCKNIMEPQEIQAPLVVPAPTPIVSRVKLDN